MFHQTFLSQQVKRGFIISNKYNILVGAFSENSQWSSIVNYLRKRLHLSPLTGLRIHPQAPYVMHSANKCQIH